jgi:chromosome segregation ATPase
MKDKRTYTKQKEHGEDMSHENERKHTNDGIKEDRGPLDITLLTEQYKADLNAYKEREGLYIKTENQLKGTKAIVIEMSGTIRELKTQNDNFQAEIARLREEIQLLVKALGPLPPKTSPISMYHGSRITELAACGLKLDACHSDWDACRLALEAC